MTRLMISLLILISPPMAIARDCMTWALCPYLPDMDDPSQAYLSLSNSGSLRLLDGITWYEIPVAGREHEYGQALVCVYSETEPKEMVDEAVIDGVCDVLQRGQVNAYMIAPFGRYFDQRTSTGKFMDGENGNARRPRVKHPLSINRNITDAIVRPITRDSVGETPQ